MTKNEMLLKLLAQSGWVATSEKDEDGYTKAVAIEYAEEKLNKKVSDPDQGNR